MDGLQWGRAGDIGGGMKGWPQVAKGRYGARMAYVYLLIAIVAEVIATAFLKQSEGFTRLGPTLVSGVGYCIAFYCLSLTLRDVPTGIACAIWSGVGIVLIAAVSWAFQGQRLDMPAVVGMGLILAGILVMNIFSRSMSH
jgi:small multidrug resistance pump